ncbi:MAG: DUF2442 domain-containing protein [Parachlamydiaceae bacterium]|nr:DUF2442 domain-containing protein [Parachlamydiaceae bacterium]
MLHIIKRVEYIEDYKLKLSFDDGKVKIVDLAERLKAAKNMFLPLLNVDYFKEVKSDGTTIVWPNGLDLCPDALYDIGQDVKDKKSQARLKPKKVSSSSHSSKTKTRIATKA